VVNLDQSNGLFQSNLLNFPAYLRSIKLQSFARWYILSICVKENHLVQMNLADLSQDDVIYRGLARSFSESFLRLSDREKKTLEGKIMAFRKYQQSSALICQIMLNLQIETWKTALEIFCYFKQEFYDAQNVNSNLPHDSNRVFILFCLT